MRFEQDIIKGYNYNNIFLIPEETIVSSRKECDTSVILGERKFTVPVYASNMKSVVNLNTCLFFAKNDYFYTMHRFHITSLEVVDFCISNDIFSSISVGVNSDSYEDLEKLKKANKYPEYITIDIANAFCQKARNMIEYLLSNFKKSFIIVGNVATPQAVYNLNNYKVGAIKVGIAGGSVCITKNKTGFHVPMVTCLINCCQASKIPIIADGGIVEHGDIAKAIACGAKMVMAGSLFAGYAESAGDLVDINGHLYKEYYGSASEFNKGEYKNVEGKKKLIDYKGSMSGLIVELKEDLQSSISYAGGKDLSALQNVKMLYVT